MDLITLLKRLQDITADPTYAERSRRAIVGLRGAGGTRRMPTLTEILRSTVEAGSTIVFVGVLIVLVLGGFSTGTLLTPAPLKSLDATALSAEAEAIDIQIKLTNLYLEKSFSTLVNEPTALGELPESDHTASSELGEETAVPAITLEEALDILGQ